MAASSSEIDGDSLLKKQAISVRTVEKGKNMIKNVILHIFLILFHYHMIHLSMKLLDKVKRLTYYVRK